ncbi:MAG: hypothetical protein MUO94_05280, partial [Thermoplasmata archaeon]|nr:hypothetical protein [Thermoplasmata archaeon]
DALKTTPVLVILSVGMLVYFVLRIPDAVNWWPSPDPRLSGFFSSTGGPTAGFFVALLACGLQVSASILYVQFLRRGKIEM